MDDDYLFDDNNKEQEEKQEDNKEDKKDEKPAETEKKEVMDVLMDEEGKEQKKGANKYPDENSYNRISSHFKKIKLVENSKMEQIFDSKEMDHYVETYGIFYCEQNNEIDGETCQPEKLFCKKCTSNIQKLYNLRPNYLINDRLRICTFKRNRIYCNGKFSKIEKKDGIDYSYFYRCGHSGYCDACQRINKYIDKYFDSKLLENLRKRDKNFI